jgi:hypothetical protein
MPFLSIHKHIVTNECKRTDDRRYHLSIQDFNMHILTIERIQLKQTILGYYSIQIMDCSIATNFTCYDIMWGSCHACAYFLYVHYFP